MTTEVLAAVYYNPKPPATIGAAAFLDGVAAYERGDAFSQCPHFGGTVEGRAWFRGWIWANEEKNLHKTVPS